MGCLRRIGCLVLILLLAAAAWFTRDRWLGYFRAAPRPTAEAPVHWERLTAVGAGRARAALDSLQSKRGPVFQNVQPGDASAYVMQTLFGRLPSDADSAEAAVVGDELYLRARVTVRELGGSEVLGSLASMVTDREPLTLGGTFRVVHPGLTEYRVTQASVGPVRLPGSVLPRLLARVAERAHLDTVRDNALPIPTPKYLVDIRVADGHVTLYKGLP